MSKDESGEPSTLTEIIVAELMSRSESSLTKEQVAPFVEAVMQGLEAAANKAVIDEDRLAHVEAVMHNLETAADKASVDEERLLHVEKQTQGLAEAVIAITETADTLAPAVKAVKDEMTGATLAPAPTHLKRF